MEEKKESVGDIPYLYDLDEKNFNDVLKKLPKYKKDLRIYFEIKENKFIVGIGWHLDLTNDLPYKRVYWLESDMTYLDVDDDLIELTIKINGKDVKLSNKSDLVTIKYREYERK